MDISLILFIAIPVVALLTMGIVFSKLYTRSTKERSFVRTGLGGQKVIMNGGALVLPVLHDIIMVNMNTIRLVVNRKCKDSLITSDRMRVDVTAEFYVRVKPTNESIADAAQTLGSKTLVINELKDLVEGKFVDALRSVAAEMSMEHLHEKRTDFVQKVQRAVTEDLLKNGMELESVSLTSLDQTNKEFFNPNNAFDAEGLLKLTQEIESRNKSRNDIEQSTKIAIQKKNLEAEKESLSIKKDNEYARLEQQREISIKTQEESTSTAKQRAEKRQEAEEAEIKAQQSIDLAQLSTNQAIQEETIQNQKAIKEQSIKSEQAIQSAEITKNQAIQSAEINKNKTLEIASQDKAIAISEKSKEESEAKAEAEDARALAVKAEENVTTVKETEVANRNKEIEIIKAKEEAEKDAVSITIAADAEKKASKDKADSIEIIAEANKNADMMKAETKEKEYSVDAAGKKEMVDAENSLSPEIIEMKIKMKTIENLPKIIEQSVKPIEAIESIKIVQYEGLNGIGSSTGTSVEGAPQSTNMADSMAEAALKYKAQAPMINNLLNELGMNADSLNGLTECITPKKDVPESDA
jgi:uncharacterized membrane protein YqiK